MPKDAEFTKEELMEGEILEMNVRLGRLERSLLPYTGAAEHPEDDPLYLQAAKRER